MASESGISGVQSMGMPANVELPKDLKPAGTSGKRLLEIERARASFSTDELAKYLYGQEYLDRMKRILSIVEAEEAFSKRTIHYLGRTDKFKHGLRKEKRFVQLAKEHQWSKEDMEMAEFLIDMPAAFGLHKSMWITTVRNQGTEEQHKMFLEPSLNFDIIGCYAQTELAHGSNVQGLETTATWVQETQEFELHSPSLTASKWWIGGLGRSADHAAVMAQLIINGKKYGPHPFVVPLRDLKTRQPLPGRTIGDIGPKVGYLMTDNGFLLLDHVRIPHNHFLAKYSQVDPNTGEFSKPAHPQLAYGTMTFIRAGIVRSARDVIARAATIAIRYCAIRRQFVDKDAPQVEDQRPVENQVLNYSLVQYRLLPVLAQAFAFHYTGVSMYKQYNDNQDAMAGGDFSLLADTHASSSALKSLSTITAANAIETCRRACGGHGYSLAAGMGSQYADYLPQVTWEGDSYMLTQQATKYLMKAFRTIYADPKRKTDGSPTASYIKNYLDDPTRKADINYSGDFHSPEMFIDAFGFRAAHIIGQLLKKRDIERRSWNSLLTEIFRASTAHAQFVLVWNFGNAIMHDAELKRSPALHQVMQQCFELFACYTMDSEAADFQRSGYLSAAQAELLRSKVDELLAIVRPQAVALVDGFKLPDYLLNSALGRDDGDVYRALFDFAVREPLNGVRFNVDYRSTDLTVEV